MGAAVLAICLVLPASAAAWTVTVNVHGAGQIDEIGNRNLFNCSVQPTGKSETSETACIGGTPGGLYSSGDVVNLLAEVDTSSVAYARGWRFSRWVDHAGGLGSGKINCDPQGTTGNHTLANCQFQIFENLEVDLHFDDVHGPDGTEVTSGPNGPTNQTSASFGFKADDDPDALFECRLDTPAGNGVYSPCGGPFDKSQTYSGLTTNGNYTFRVLGVDPSGNPDSSPASRTFTVDTVAPVVSLTGGPAAGSSVSSDSASFSIGVSGSTSLQCTLNGSLRACGPGLFTLTNLTDGTKTLAVTAFDDAGNSASASRSWTVDTTDPVPVIGGGPAEGALVSSRDASFTTATNEGALSCALDGDSLPSCSSPVGLTAIGDGPHTFRLTATDAAGNEGATTRSWTVDGTAPETTIASGPADGATQDSGNVTFGLAADEATVGYECRLYPAGTTAPGFQPCSDATAHAASGLSPGTYVFEARATDAAGNVDPSPARRSFTYAAAPPADSTDPFDRAAPDTLFDRTPRERFKTRKSHKRVRFHFSSTEPGSSFSCEIDGDGFEPCASPFTIKVKRGEHRFSVRASDSAGNVDPTPAVHDFKVKRKRSRA